MMSDQPKKTDSAARKKVGYPAPGRRKIVPDDYDEIGKLWGSGWTFRRIAAKYGVHLNTISTHFKNHIFPMVQASSTRSIEAELLKIDTLERIAWECFWSEEPAELREQVKEQLEKLGSPRETDRNKAANALEKTAATIHRPRDKSWLELVRWCIDMRCKLAGHYAAAKVTVKLEEYRVAGRSPGEGMATMVQRIIDKTVERRNYEERINPGGASAN